ncbi:TetR/AcrR family transcriptional regulator [Streptomyces sp. x-80]|uniref:TetR/AcrR family transcriptional regulator n=1 Tax=Streptomyces sp. x-80 TaxID=2789282 RepID=UPI00397F967D
MARTGRPRQFDRDDVLEAALRLFWEHGYAATSLAQLREAMRMSSASFYAAFSSKEQLFDAVVERYASSFGRVTDAIADDELPPREAVERILRQSAQMQTDASHPSGCLLVSGATCSPANVTVHELLTGRRNLVRANVVACVERAKSLGELPSGTDAQALASVFVSFLWGLSTEARDGVPAGRLDAAVGYLMGVWDATAVAHTGSITPQSTSVT